MHLQCVLKLSTKRTRTFPNQRLQDLMKVMRSEREREGLMIGVLCTVFVAMESYAAENDDEVGFKAGDKIEVVNRNMDGWWKIRSAEREELMKKCDERVLPFTVKAANSQNSLEG